MVTVFYQASIEPEEMPHKLKLSLSVEPQTSDEFKTLLKSPMSGFDAVRGLPVKVSITTRNISNQPFPGGKISSIRLNYQRSSQEAGEAVLPSIVAGQSCAPFEMVLIPLEPGIALISLTVAASDGQPVECFQRDERKPFSTGNWMDVFYVVDKESFSIMTLLVELLKK